MSNSIRQAFLVQLAVMSFLSDRSSLTVSLWFTMGTSFPLKVAEEQGSTRMPFFGTGALKSTYRVYFSVHQILCSSVRWQNMEKGNLEWPEQVTSCRRPGSISPTWLWRLLNPAMSVKPTRDKMEKNRHGCVAVKFHLWVPRLQFPVIDTWLRY